MVEIRSTHGTNNFKVFFFLVSVGICDAVVYM